MSRKGNCWDNAVAESFFKTIKHEWLYRFNFKSFSQLYESVQDYIKTGEELGSIMTMIEEINEISAQNSTSVNEISGAAGHLTSMTKELNNKLNQFKTN